jgi:hypothetical protein
MSPLVTGLHNRDCYPEYPYQEVIFLFLDHNTFAAITKTDNIDDVIQ